MRSIFWKIFLSFWLVMVLIVAAGVLASFQLAGRYTHFVDEIDRRDLMREAATVISGQGVKGFESWLDNDAILPQGMTIYLVDGGGRDALGRRMPPRVEQHWRRFRERRERRQERFRPRPPGSDPRSREFEYRAPDGQTYRPILGPAPPRVFGVLGIPRIALLVLALGILISAVICYVLSRYLTRPITRIAGVAEHLASGKLESRVGSSAYRADEIGKLARQFDRMASELERSESVRRDLFRNVSHELRSPLARIQVALELARRKPDEGRVHLQRIEHEARHMERLIEQVLELVRVQQDPGIAPQPLSLIELVSAVVEDARFEGKPENKRIETDVPPEDIVVNGYHDVLASAIENVLRNAIAHTPPDSTVHVRLWCEDERAMLSVCDQGPGVPEQELERLFEPFYRHSDNRMKGAGVGLAITAQGVELMGGAVLASNDSSGGLCVTITLPQAPS